MIVKRKICLYHLLNFTQTALCCLVIVQNKTTFAVSNWWINAGYKVDVVTLRKPMKPWENNIYRWYQILCWK